MRPPSCTSAFAQEYQPGVHGGVNIPVGDLGDALDNRPGIPVGGQLGIYYGNGHELRPRVDLTSTTAATSPWGRVRQEPHPGWGRRLRLPLLHRQQPVGMYLTGGLGYQWWDVSPEHGGDSSHSGLAVALGAGYRFNRNFMLEGRFTTAQFRSNNGQANALQAVASMRF